MKRSVLRIVCAFLLMGLALSAAIGFFASGKEETTVFAWQRVRFASEGEIRLYDEEGSLLQTLTPTGGFALSKLLPEGRYYAFSGQTCTVFYLHTDCTIAIEGGCGWSEGQTLHLTNEPVGSVRAEFIAQQAYYTFSLVGEAFSERKTVHTSIGQTVNCEFLGLPYGTYQLYRGGEAVGSICIDANTPNVTLALTKG